MTKRSRDRLKKTILQLEEVTWRRQGQSILKGINWQVKEEEHWAVLGLNGSGKTSILNIITGYSYPTSGAVKVLDTKFGEASLPKLREEIGYVSSALDRFGSTFNNQRVKHIILSGKFSTVGLYNKQDITESDWHLVQAILEELRIGYLSEQAFSTLSQGEKRRVLIGRALMNRPRLMILDEPCSGLDILAREELLQQMNSIVKQDCHLIYVTHHIEEITPAITHILLIRDGEVVSSGPKNQVLTAENLTNTFKVNVKVRWENDRPWISVVH